MKNTDTIARKCPSCLPDHLGDFDRVWGSRASLADGRETTDYECRNCGHIRTVQHPRKAEGPTRKQQEVRDQIASLADRTGQTIEEERMLGERLRLFVPSGGCLSKSAFSVRIGRRGSLEVTIFSFGSSGDRKSKSTRQAWSMIEIATTNWKAEREAREAREAEKAREVESLVDRIAALQDGGEATPAWREKAREAIRVHGLRKVTREVEAREAQDATA